MRKTFFMICLLAFSMITVFALAADSKQWDCPNCGAKGNTGNYCGQCGIKAVEAWKCSGCGQEGNTGNFCKNCGSKKETSVINQSKSVTPQTQDIEMGKLIMSISSEFQKTSAAGIQHLYIAEKPSPNERRLTYQILETKNMPVPEGLDFDYDLGHTYEVLMNYTTKKENDSHINFSKHKMEPSFINGMPCVILKAITGNVIWDEISVYYQGHFYHITYLAEIENTNADHEFEQICQSLSSIDSAQ